MKKLLDKLKNFLRLGKILKMEDWNDLIAGDASVISEEIQDTILNFILYNKEYNWT